MSNAEWDEIDEEEPEADDAPSRTVLDAGQEVVTDDYFNGFGRDRRAGETDGHLSRSSGATVSSTADHV